MFVLVVIVVRAVIVGIACCERVLFGMCSIVRVRCVWQSFMKTFVTEERHPHHPGHVDCGQHGGKEPYTPEDIIPGLRQIMCGEGLVKDLVL